MPSKLLKKTVVFALATGVLLLVLGAYTNPDFIVTTANQIWFCFS